MNILKWSEQFKKDMTVKNYDDDDTIPNYLAQISLFLKFFEKDYNHPKHIPAEKIKDYLLTKIKVNTQRHSHSAIKLFYRLTVHQEFKFRFIEYAKKEHTPIIILSINEIQRLINSCSNLKHKAIIVFTYSTGVRVSELLNIKLNDIDPSNGVVHILSGKGKKARQVTMKPELYKFILKHISEYNPKEYLFENDLTHERYSASSINQFLKKYAKLAEINKKVHIHLLRHNYTTDSIDNGAKLYEISKALGHSSTKITEKTYIHCSSKLIANAYSPINNISI